MFNKIDFLNHVGPGQPTVKKLANAENNEFSGSSFFKENLQFRNEISTSGFESPVNNFLKDRIEINQEFRQAKRHEFCLCLDGRMVTASEILDMRMEENY
jgi:hypothetical protein